MNAPTRFASALASGTGCPFLAAKAADVEAPRTDFPMMPIGQACDMGHAADGTPLIDPRLFDSLEYMRNPYPYWRIMRDHYPIYHDKLHNCYYVTRYADVEHCYFDDEGFNTIPKGSSSHVLGNTQLELSGVEHLRRRNLYGQHLVGKSLEVRVPVIEKLARQMITDWDSLANKCDYVLEKDGVRTVELAQAFANAFPISVVCGVLGFPDEARGDFVYWYSSMMRGLGGSPTHKQGYEARQHLDDYVEGLVAARRREPAYLTDVDGNIVSKDIITKLCETKVDGDYLSTEEISSNIALVVGGGGDTTRGAILHMWYMLLVNRNQYDAVMADDGLWDAVFHETMRCCSSVGGQPRHNSYDVEMHGVQIPAGSLMHVLNMAANHDERVFKNPETFDIFRDDLYTGKIIRSGFKKDGRYNHMAFGVGPHLCPGAWISHQESVIGSKVLAGFLKNARLNPERVPRDVHGGLLTEIGLPFGPGDVQEVWIDYDVG